MTFPTTRFDLEKIGLTIEADGDDYVVRDGDTELARVDISNAYYDFIRDNNGRHYIDKLDSRDYIIRSVEKFAHDLQSGQRNRVNTKEDFIKFKSSVEDLGGKIDEREFLFYVSFEGIEILTVDLAYGFIRFIKDSDGDYNFYKIDKPEVEELRKVAYEFSDKIIVNLLSRPITKAEALNI